MITVIENCSTIDLRPVPRGLTAHERTGIDPLARCDEIRLRASISGGPTAGEIRDAIVVRHLPLGRPHGNYAVRVSRIRDADVPVVALRTTARLTQLVEPAITCRRD